MGPRLPALAALPRTFRDEWATLTGYGLYVAFVAAGYYYNLTFVQLGLIDLGTRVVGLTRATVSVGMAGLALLAFAAAVVTGVALDRTGKSTDFRAKLRLLWGVVTLQWALTLAAPHVGSSTGFAAWLALCSLSLGVGMPVTFALTIDLVPVGTRGYAAAAATAVAYFLANVYPLDWQIESFAAIMSVAMAPAVLVLAVVAFRRNPFVRALADRHADAAYGIGRFCRDSPVRTRSLEFVTLVVLMFGVFFVDSLGFLRITDTPVYVLSSWQSPEFSVHLFIALVHVVTAVAAGVLYRNFGRRWLFLWVFGLFSLTHLLYTFDVRTVPSADPALLLPGFYSAAVSVYTTLNFALWPDVSTPETIGTHTALGIGFGGWLATFLSTALSLYFQETGVSLFDHLTYVNALALLLFFALVVLLYARRMLRIARANRGAAADGGERA